MCTLKKLQYMSLFIKYYAKYLIYYTIYNIKYIYKHFKKPKKKQGLQHRPIVGTGAKGS